MKWVGGVWIIGRQTIGVDDHWEMTSSRVFHVSFIILATSSPTGCFSHSRRADRSVFLSTPAPAFRMKSKASISDFPSQGHIVVQYRRVSVVAGPVARRGLGQLWLGLHLERTQRGGHRLDASGLGARWYPAIFQPALLRYPALRLNLSPCILCHAYLPLYQKDPPSLDQRGKT